MMAARKLLWVKKVVKEGVVGIANQASKITTKYTPKKY